MKYIKILFLLSFSCILHAQTYVDYWTRALDDFDKRNYHGCISNLNLYLNVVPNDPNAFYNRAVSKLNLGDVNGACEDLSLAENLGINTLNNFGDFLCDSLYKLKILKRQFYEDEVLVAQNNYRPVYTLKDTLRGSLRPERTCFDVYFYDLQVRINPKKKKIEGRNTIYFHETENSNTIQIDLFDVYDIHAIESEGKALSYRREFNAIFVDFPEGLKKGSDYAVTITYSGKPPVAKNPPWEGGFVWDKDNNGDYWDGVACEHLGASSWWPNKDHLSDEPDSMRLTFIVPEGYKAVSNGVLRNETNEGKNEKKFEWFVHYPINNYNATFYLGKFSFFSDTLQIDGKDLLMKYYVLPYNLEKAKEHFKQSEKIVGFYSRVYGDFPFMEDGFGLVESPYEGMEHQTAIAYGNSYNNENNNLFRKKEYDYIIIHEAAHEWWGNAVSAVDMADIWIHEGFATYSELLFIEDVYGKEEYDYESMAKRKYIFNFWPLVENYGVNENSFASSDVYNKGAMVLFNLRCILNDDSLFFSTIRSFFDSAKYHTVTTDEFIHHVNYSTGRDLSAFFDKYLRREYLPVLAYRFRKDDNGNILFTYWWEGVKEGFNMPFAIRTDDGSSLRFEGSVHPAETVLEKVQWFNFYNEWQTAEGAAHNSLTYFRTRWAE